LPRRMTIFIATLAIAIATIAIVVVSRRRG
jgi:hypothetical protein